MIKEFNINISEEEIKALKQKISLTRWPDELDNENWIDGTNMKFLKNLCAYWVNGFDWKKQEDVLNKKDSLHKDPIDQTMMPSPKLEVEKRRKSQH